MRCLRWRELDQNDNSASIISPRRVGTRPPQPDAVLVAEDLRVYYPVGRRRGLEHDSYLKAVDGVTLTVRQGCITAIVGESGCGKSSLGAAIVGLRTLSAGRLTFDDRDISRPVRQRPSVVHRLLQMVFQDHSATLNPSVSIGRIIGRPLRLFSTVPAKEVGAEVRRLLKAVGLDESINRRKPAQLSGGQRQRVAIARAFAGRPHLVVCDEITSALDVSVQASVLNFLLDLQRSSQTSLIFISHDLGVVRYIADEVIVMYLGRVCESGPADDVFAGPNHPYTEALLSAVPIPDPEAAVVRVRLQGPIPSPLAPPQGCPFHTRCHRKLEGLCETETPPLRDLGADHRVWCHLPLGSSETERESLRRGRALMAR